MDKFNVVELPVLEDLELLHDALCAGLIGVGVSSLEARVDFVVAGEIHWPGIPLLDWSFSNAR